MMALPNAPGRESASTPGNPWNSAERASSGKRSGPRLESGRCMGEISSPDCLNDSAYSNSTAPEAGSSATAPTSRPHSITVATAPLEEVRRLSGRACVSGSVIASAIAVVASCTAARAGCPLTNLPRKLHHLEWGHERLRHEVLQGVQPAKCTE